MSDLGEFEEEQRTRRLRAGCPPPTEWPDDVPQHHTWRDFLPKVCNAVLLLIIFWALAAVLAMYPVVKF